MTANQALLLIIAAGLRLAASTIAPDAVPSLRDACEADLLTLQPCAQNNPDFAQLCCAAVRALASNGCFCAWSDVDYVSGWTRSALLDLEERYERCTDSHLLCPDDRTPSAMWAASAALPSDDDILLISPSDVDVLQRLQQWISALPGMEYANVEATADEDNQRTLVVEWTQQIESALPRGALPADLDIEVELTNLDDGSSSQGSWRTAIMPDLRMVGDWLVNGVTGLLQGPQAQEDPMDRTDDVKVLVGTLMQVMDQMLQHVDGEDFSVSLEVTIDEEEEEDTVEQLPPQLPQLPSRVEQQAAQLLDMEAVHEQELMLSNRHRLVAEEGAWGQAEGVVESVYIPHPAAFVALWAVAAAAIGVALFTIGKRMAREMRSAAAHPMYDYLPPQPAEASSHAALSKPLLQHALAGGH